MRVLLPDDTEVDWSPDQVAEAIRQSLADQREATRKLSAATDRLAALTVAFAGHLAEPGSSLRLDGPHRGTPPFLDVSRPPFVRYGQTETKLTAKLFGLVAYLVEREGAATYTDVEKAVWGSVDVSCETIARTARRARAQLIKAGIPYDILTPGGTLVLEVL